VKLRTVGLLLAVWCVLAIAPAVIIALFVGVDTEDPSGAVLILWIVGYLAQIGVFLVISLKTSGAGGFLGWVIASLVPWSANWAAPLAPWWLIACVAIVVGYSWWFYRSLSRSRSLQRGGVPARGVVLKVEKPLMNVVINNVYIRRTLLLRIERADGVAPYEAKFKGTFMLGEIPDAGSVLRLRVDPANPCHFEAVKDCGESHYEPPTPSSDTITDQLQQLAELHRRGDLTDAEFAAAKRRILDG
jgi:Short C-terminal domain